MTSLKRSLTSEPGSSSNQDSNKRIRSNDQQQSKWCAKEGFSCSLSLCRSSSDYPCVYDEKQKYQGLHYSESDTLIETIFKALTYHSTDETLWWEDLICYKCCKKHEVGEIAYQLSEAKFMRGMNKANFHVCIDLVKEKLE